MTTYHKGNKLTYLIFLSGISCKKEQSLLFKIIVFLTKEKKKKKKRKEECLNRIGQQNNSAKYSFKMVAIVTRASH